MTDINEILQSHIKDTQAFQSKAIEKLSAIETHNKYTHERLDKVEAIGKDYEKNKNLVWGGIVSLSAIFGAVWNWIYDLFHK